MNAQAPQNFAAALRAELAFQESEHRRHGHMFDEAMKIADKAKACRNLAANRAEALRKALPCYHNEIEALDEAAPMTADPGIPAPTQDEGGACKTGDDARAPREGVTIRAQSLPFVEQDGAGLLAGREDEEADAQPPQLRQQR